MNSTCLPVKTCRRVAWRFASFLLFAMLPSRAADAWKPVPGNIMTRWAKDVSPKNPHPEYPRPTMVREQWQNLNGLWDYAIVPTNVPTPTQWAGKILVPFPVESALSGVKKTVGASNRLWYLRTFTVPRKWRGQRVRLNFGAVDWEAVVFVNGKQIGSHRGGYDGFSFDITDALKPSGEQELIVSVWDPSDDGTQPRGKQVKKGEGIWYTPSTGIWQTPWLEPVSPSYFQQGLRITPNVDRGTVEVGFVAKLARPIEVKIQALEGRNVIAEAGERAGGNDSLFGPTVSLRIPSAKLWSPESPFLYGLRLSISEDGKTVDEVSSYFGMRKIALAKDDQGVLRMQLNNQTLFQYGPLDQGFWPDGLYTAPTDEALRWDIEMTKKLGFNMARKHVKVEPERWYYWCDKLGLLVWQDMPSGDKSARWQGPSGFDGEEMKRSKESAAIYEREWKAIMDARYNHPCIVTWVPFNEGWGQFDTVRILNWTKQYDPTRLVDGASGGNHFPAGDILDHHQYPGPGAPKRVTDRAMVLGEFGGLGLPVKGHTWQEEKNWGYRSFTDAEALTDNYVALTKKLHPMIEDSGLSAAIYTQTTDVEVEVNGLMTYDREVVKMPAAVVAAANNALYKPFEPRRAEAGKLVPPATPLVAVDPYFSIWSQGDKLTDADTTHWTGKPHRLTSLVRIDGKAYRVMGANPARVPALEQKSVTVLPTRTIYTFAGAGVELTLTFMTPALPDDLDVLSWPITYVTYDLKATDRKTHEVTAYFDANGEVAVNEGRQQVVGDARQIEKLTTVRIGSKDQPVLGRKGDDLRIDWGHFYLAADSSAATTTLVPGSDLRNAFTTLQRADLKTGLPETVAADSAVASLVFSTMRVSDTPTSRHLILAYDDLYSIQYMKQNLRPYWRRSGWEAADLLKAAANDYESLKQRCTAFDEELMADLRRAGGENYARLGALAYRQCFAAGKFVADANGQPISFCKENHSNGCIGTSDVFYPMAPQFLLFGPTLAKSFLVPFMNYAASDRWKFPFAPHDLGTYPKANGQVYGDGERGVNNQMPVEESGNLLLLFGAIAQMEGNADFAGLYWKQLEQWAQYLKEKGFDPENQLCTDDFAGHLAHNVNLSAKAICGLGAFAKLCDRRGDKAKADEYFKRAREFAAKWVKEADDGDHFRLAFDRPGTWSQKYNLVWDRILGLNLFPDSVRRKEMDYYRKIQNKFGLPLDNRKEYTKLDWITWTATLTQDRKDFEALIDPILTFLNETPDRSPMTDWYQTKTAKKVGFTARPVVGGVFLQMLYDKTVWAKWAARDKTKASGWAPMPKPPTLITVVPTSQQDGLTWRYTTTKPADDWFKAGFDDSSWKSGPGGFGTRQTPGAVVRTEWNARDIWMRREFELPAGDWKNLSLFVHHDEDVRIYINGLLAASATGYTSGYEELTLNAVGKAALKPGKNLFAVHCRQTQGGQYIDVGIVELAQNSIAAPPGATGGSVENKTQSAALYAGEMVKATTKESVTVPVPKAKRDGHYVQNREPLTPAPFMKLPIGAIQPRGWLRHQLELEAQGMVGRLPELSPWLNFRKSSWAAADGSGDYGWEEMPYWLKGFGDLAYALRDEKLIAEAKTWIEAILRTQREDGYFGPRMLLTSLKGEADLWPHMLVNNILQSWFEYCGDDRVLPFLMKYHRWLNAQPDSAFSAGYWPRLRWGDNIETCHWLYNRTGEKFLLELAGRIHRNMGAWRDGIVNWHNVNLAQGFREPAVFFTQSGAARDLAQAEANYRELMGVYGQFAGGGFAGDENCRPGFTDPRQGFETCGMVEFTHSFEMLAKISGDVRWSDRAEDIAFNSLPAAIMPDWKGLHYLTCANQVQLDRHNKAPALQNGGTMVSYSPFEVYRCCQHNVSHGWPYYAQELWLATADRGLAASLYAASETTAKVGDGTSVKVVEETDYPFNDTITLRLSTSKAVKFPLHLRIPHWAGGASIAVNGKAAKVAARPSSFAILNREWQNGDTVTLTLPMKVSTRTWAKNQNSVSVDYGPLTFSLKIGERWEPYGNRSADWPEHEVFASTPWNYGLELDSANPATSFAVVKKPGPIAKNPFTHETAPIELRAKARRIPAWQADRLNMVGKLQPSPVKSSEPVETVSLIPMGAARLRITSFPVIGNGSGAHEWTAPVTPPITASHNSSDSVEAMIDGIEPRHSNDHDIPRFTWWDHRGTEEWVEWGFPKAKEVSEVAVYWFDDTGRGQCRVPQSWRVLHRSGERWLPVEGASAYGTAKDQYNRVTFKPVSAEGLRVEVQLQRNASGGILEWKAR